MTPRRATGALAAVATCAALLAAAPALAAATLSAPSTVTAGASVTVRARGLVRASYGLYIAYTERLGKGGEPIDCDAAIGPLHRNVAGSATFTGRLPSRLTCRTGAGPSLGTVPLRAGRYDLAVGSPAGAGVFNANASFVKRTVTVVA